MEFRHKHNTARGLLRSPGPRVWLVGFSYEMYAFSKEPTALKAWFK